MLIGIDASRANRRHKTGTEWYSYYLIKKLAQLDSKNEYILYVDKPALGGLLDLGSDEDNSNNEIKYDKKGFQIAKSPYNNFKIKVLKWPFSHFWTLGRLTLEMVFKKPDVLFVPSHTLPLVYPKRTINTIHDVAFERDRDIYWQKTLGPDDKLFKKFLNLIVKIFTYNKYSASSQDYLSWSTRFALKHAKKIITVSNFSKKEILDIYESEPKLVTVVYNGYNTKLYKKINDEEKIKSVLAKYGVEGPYFFYIGRLEKKKNTSFLIESFAIMREYNRNITHKLVLAGDASFGYDEVKYMIREFNLDEEVIMPGWVKEKDTPYFYNGATAFIFPSKHEGFGIPVIQAMGCETPVLSSNIPALREIADKAALYFDPNDKRETADAMAKIIENKELRNSLIRKGRERVSSFSWEKCAKETLKVINSL